MKKPSWFLILLGLFLLGSSLYIKNNNYWAGTNETILNEDILNVLLYLGSIVSIMGLVDLFIVKKKIK